MPKLQRTHLGQLQPVKVRTTADDVTQVQTVSFRFAGGTPAKLQAGGLLDRRSLCSLGRRPPVMGLLTLWAGNLRSPIGVEGV